MNEIEVPSASPDGLILQRVREWMVQFVEAPNPLLNGFAPCPFAKRARLQNELFVRVARHESFAADLAEACAAVMDGSKRVALLAFADTEKWPVEKCAAAVDRLRETWRAQDLYFMWDHPQVEETVGRLRMNQGEYFLLFVQRLSELRMATLELEAKGYYQSWDADQLKDLIGTRWKE